jgi:histidinol phosphatase-like enzyme
MSLKKTIFIDLDGCLVKHNYYPLLQEEEYLDGSIEKLLEWRDKGYYIILTTGRTFYGCKNVFTDLKKFDFTFDQILCELPPTKRILINDNKFEGVDKAQAICITRDVGIGSIEI